MAEEKSKRSLITNFFVLISLGLKAINIMALIPSITKQYNTEAIGETISNKVESVTGRFNQ